MKYFLIFAFIVLIALFGALPLMASQQLELPAKRQRLTGKEQINLVKKQIKNVVKAVQLFATDCGRFPTEKEGLQALLSPPVDCPHTIVPYLESIPTDLWGAELGYAKLSTPPFFAIRSFGADRKVGGIGRDADLISLVH